MHTATLPPVRNIEQSISKEKLLEFISEKLYQYGFREEDHILKIELPDLPDIIKMKIKFKKDQEGEVKEYKLNG